jgi:HPt (histidine-containing phosphotransfer) domain-containing protein
MTSAAEAGHDHDEAAPAPVDETVLDTLVEEVGDGDRSLLDDLIGSYLEEAAGMVAQLEAGARSGDAPAVAAVAHSLKSSSAALGALPFAAMLQRVEQEAKQGTADLAGLVAPIHGEYARVADALSRQVSGGQTR